MLNGGSFEEFVLNLVKIDTKLILGGKKWNLLLYCFSLCTIICFLVNGDYHCLEGEVGSNRLNAITRSLDTVHVCTI
jgi:hypothetical protein